MIQSLHIQDFRLKSQVNLNDVLYYDQIFQILMKAFSKLRNEVEAVNKTEEMLKQ